MKAGIFAVALSEQKNFERRIKSQKHDLRKLNLPCLMNERGVYHND